MDDITAVVVAAGKGHRMAAGMNKVYLELAGRPVLAHTLDVFERIPDVRRVVLVVAPGEEQICRERVINPFGLTKVTRLVAGGAERVDSVFHGLQAVPGDCQLVVVHDGARPLFTSELLRKTVEAASGCGGALAAVPVKDTIKVADETGMVVSTPVRRHLWAAQTPQAFRLPALKEAYRQVRAKGVVVTDDAMVMELAGYPVKVVMGDYENLKVTTPEDLVLAEAILRRRREACG